MGIVGIAVIVFAIMYLFLVEKMGKRFKQEADAAHNSGRRVRRPHTAGLTPA